MMRRIRRKRMLIASMLMMAIFLCGCTTLLNGDLTVAYLTEEERAEIESQSGVGAVINYQDSIFNPQMYESEYPDAFYIPEKYSKEPQDIRGFELLDFVNGDTFIYAYQTMVYKDTGTAPSLVPVSGDYVFYENRVTEDTRELSEKMVTVLAANRYTTQKPGEGYQEICSWTTEATDNQSFFANAVGELEKGTGEENAKVGSYAVYFNGYAVVYQADKVREALEKGVSPESLIEYNFSEVIQDITEEIMAKEGINHKNESQYQFDINDVSFYAGEDHVDVYMMITQSKIMEDSAMEEENQRVDQMLEAPASFDEEGTVDESQYSMKSYDVHMGFYAMDYDFSFTIQNIRCNWQIDLFQRNDTNLSIDYEWNVSDNSIYFLTKQDVLRRIPSAYSDFFLKSDGKANAFAASEAIQIGSVCSSRNFEIDGYYITGRLRMTDQRFKEAVRKGYYMDGNQWVEYDMRASFILSRSFTLEEPMVLAYCWNSQREKNNWQYSKCFVMNGILAEYATYIPEENSGNRLELLDINLLGSNYWGNDWNDFTRWFLFSGGRNYHQRINHIPAINSIAGRVFDGKAYIFCYTQDGVYLYPIEPVTSGFLIGQSVLLDYDKLNFSARLTQNRNDDSQMESILQQYQETDLYRASLDPDQLTVSGSAVPQKEYVVNDTAPEIFPDYSINYIRGLWTENQRHEFGWTLCTTSSGLEIIKSTGEPYIPVFQKNVIYAYEAENEPVSYYQQLTRLEKGVTAYAVFENPGEDKESYPFLLLGYDYQDTVYTAMDIARAKVIPFAVVEPGRRTGGTAGEAWERVEAEQGESRVYYLKDCYDRSLYGTVSIVSGYKNG
ncbi:MAG: hypothetical protein K2J95_02025 [Lachnospiraceae bacterium]|nr:hypothetical protein [Lachnospiraceae bacterium]